MTLKCVAADKTDVNVSHLWSAGVALERVVLTVLTRAALLLMLLRKRDEKREGGAGGSRVSRRTTAAARPKFLSVAIAQNESTPCYAMAEVRRPLVGRFSDCEKSSRGGRPRLVRKRQPPHQPQPHQKCCLDKIHSIF